jgi:hypothetical protein
METEKKDFLAKAASLLPFITLFALLYGVTKQFIYYYQFNLNIFSYLEISELLPQTLLDLILSLIFLLFTLRVTFASREHINTDVIENIEGGYAYKIHPLDPENLNFTIQDLIRSFSQKGIKVLKPSKNFLIRLSLFLISGYFIYTSVDAMANSDEAINNPFFFQKIVFYFLTIYILISTVSYLMVKWDVRDSNLQIIIPLIIVLLFTGLLEGYFKYRYVSYFKSHNNYSITINKKPIISNARFYYIGKTKSNVFFYNDTTRFVTVFPFSSIEKMEMGAD